MAPQMYVQMVQEEHVQSLREGEAEEEIERERERRWQQREVFTKRGG